MQALIVDDELNNIENLSFLLGKYCPETTVAAKARNAEEARKYIGELHPDLVFLDIQMPGENGFDLLKSLPSYSFELIFVTGYDKFGIQAIKFSAIDYLLKPIDYQELKLAVGRAEEKYLQKRQNVQLENLMKMVQQNQQRTDHRIALPSAKETRFVRTTQIIRCEAENNYTIFYLENSEKILVSRPMFEYDELLADYGFIRCHNSHLVNKTFVRSWIKEDSGYLLMEDGVQVPISRLKKDFIKQALK
ncbi:LytR/AlgR family response regulator transcription factor [Dyadobacter psychrotolerans]|uniref:Response regulator transcription factor n=1 Tax=Dyadobacter psychrotolerans TaxID=2541721 RepID=A0A4R5DIH3_9BACT|nr:LytTR family DNA-binding domain-containing protein [Dyadobacter psychrotolerans]TDE10303.1 response regulator transcription factor [Dyadobacter psychrotolerans]